MQDRATTVKGWMGLTPMSDNKICFMEYLVFFLCGLCGILAAMILGMTCLPGGIVLFTIYCVLGAIIGAGIGRAVWNRIHNR